MPRFIIILLSSPFGPVLPHAPKEARRLALLSEAGFTSGGGDIFGIALLVVEIGEFLGR